MYLDRNWNKKNAIIVPQNRHMHDVNEWPCRVAQEYIAISTWRRTHFVNNTDFVLSKTDVYRWITQQVNSDSSSHCEIWLHCQVFFNSLIFIRRYSKPISHKMLTIIDSWQLRTKQKWPTKNISTCKVEIITVLVIVNLIKIFVLSQVQQALGIWKYVFVLFTYL